MSSEKTSWEVELVDDVSRPAKRAEGALARLQRSFQRLSSLGKGPGRNSLGQFSTGPIDRFRKSLSKLKENIGDSIGKGYEKAKEKGLAFAKTGGLVMAAIGAAVAAKVGVMAAEWADFGQRGRAAFAAVAHAGENGNELFDRSIKLAGDLGLGIQDTAKQIAKFRALQFTQGQAEALVKMGSDMSILGANAEETQRIFSQLGQIKAKGRLQGEELIVLAENGVATGLVLEELAKITGKSMKQVQKDMSNGAIGATEGLNAIGAAIKRKFNIKEFGEARGKYLATTMAGSMQLLKSQFELAFLKIGDKAAPALSKALGAISQELTSFLDSAEGAKTIDAIAEGVGSLAQWLIQAIPYVKQFVSSLYEGFKTAMPFVQGALEMLFNKDPNVDWMETIAKSGALVGKVLAVAIGMLVSFVGIVATVFRTIVAFWTMVFSLASKVTAAIGAAIFYVTDTIASLQAQFSAWWENAGTNMVDGLVRGIQNGIERIKTAAAQAGQAALASLKGTLGIASPSKEFEWLGQQSALGFDRGLGAVNDNGTPWGVKQSVDQAGQVAPSAARAAANVSSGGNRTINVTLTVQAPQGGTAADAQTWGQSAAAGIRRGLVGLLDDMALEATG